MSVDRCARMSSSSFGWMLGQIEWRASGPAAAPPGASSTSIASPMRAMSSTGTMTSSSSAFLAPASTISTSRPRAAEEPGDRRERALRGRQPDALRVGRREVAEPLEREREVRAALRGGHGVDLVDDHVLDAAQRLARLAGEQQVERLRRGDEDVGWCLHELAPHVRRRVARARADADLGHLDAQPLRRPPDAGQRRPQVALDVVGERLERADVEHADGRRRRRPARS